MRHAVRLLFAAIILIPVSGEAHRLDEYLQATRISLEVDRIVVEINLTPGAAVADKVFSTIDRNGDNVISRAEGAAYAQDVVKSVKFDVDGKTASLILDAYDFPPLADMRRGEGVIRLRAVAAVRSSVSPHQLAFVNTHRPDIGVYLVNALIPADSRLHITGMTRDMLQREFEMQYTVSRSHLEFAALWPPMVALTLALAVAFVVLARRAWQFFSQ